MNFRIVSVHKELSAVWDGGEFFVRRQRGDMRGHNPAW